MREMALPLYLPRDVYNRLAEIAAAEERDPSQQARWLIRQALESPSGDLISDRQPAGVAGT